MSDSSFSGNPNAPIPGAGGTVTEAGLLAIIWVFFSTATCFVALRLIVRFRQNRFFLYDDYWMMLAWCTLLTMVVLQMEQRYPLWYVTYLTAGRVGFDQYSLGIIEQLTRWQFPIIKLFWTVLWSVKASFMAVFFRLVKPFPVLRRLWYCVAVFAFLAFVGCWLVSAFTCSPPSDYFKPGACSEPHELWMQRFDVIYSTSVDVATDLMIMALPISILPSLQLDKRRKFGLAVAFGLSFIIISVAIVRMTQVISNVDGSVDLVGLAIWGAIETSVAVIVGSLPPLKALLSRGVKKYSARSKYTYGTGASNQGATAPSNGEYAHDSASRIVMVAESIPLDGMHTSTQKDGRIYVQRTYHTTVEFDGVNSRYDEEAGKVMGRAL